MEKISPKVVDLDAYRRRKEGFRYSVGECQMIMPGYDPSEGYRGTWTPWGKSSSVAASRAP
jgi:hypothetical protein